MYSFTGMNEQASEVQFVPSDNMKINGTPLNELIPNYQQLVVSGRGMIGETINTSDVPLRAGAWFNYTQTDDRTLTIKYKIEADTSEEVRLIFNTMNKELRKVNEDGYLDITFKDEPNWHYAGVLSSTGKVEENSLKSIDEFSLYCPDPYVYKSKQSGQRVQLEYADKVLPEKITININNATDRLEISNGREDITLNGSYSAGQIVEIIYYEDHVDVLRDGFSVLTDLERFSYPEFFYLRDGDTLDVTGGSLASIEWRDQRL